MATFSHRWLNWAGNYEFQAPELLFPESVDALAEIVAGASRVKATGTRHSFNDIADSPGTMVSLRELRSLVHLDTEARTVTIQGGMTYGELGPILHEAGFALPNLASLPHISVVGAVSTGTHGSGERNGNLSTSVSALKFVRADGSIDSISRSVDPVEFAGSVVSLGALGVVVEVTLDVVPTFEIRQDVYLDMPLANLLSEFDAIQASGYSVSLFTDWSGPTINQVWLKNLAGVTPPAGDLFGATAAVRHMHPIASVSAENCTPQMGELGPWHQRLPHFKLEFTPSNGDELQSEYFVAREYASEAIRAIDAIRDLINPQILISEIRTVASDDLWLSACYDRPGVGFHFTWKKNWPEVRQILPHIEAALRPFRPRAHWGKLFTLEAAEVQSAYPKFGEFIQLARKHGPEGKFQNAFTERFQIR